MLATIKSFIIQLPSRPTLAKEISIFIALKFIGIFLIWGLFFSHPQDEKMTQKSIAEHILS